MKLYYATINKRNFTKENKLFQWTSFIDRRAFRLLQKKIKRNDAKYFEQNP